MRTHLSNRVLPVTVMLIVGMGISIAPRCAYAQEDLSDAPLGDVARSFRKKPAGQELVIDNDNFSKVVEDAESRRASGSTMVFSLDGGGKGFQVSSPDVSCSLSFSAKTSSLLADPVMLDEIPRSELSKLDGPATLDGDSLQVSMHNGTSWELREIVIGLTIIRRSDEGNAAANGAGSFGHARMVPVAAAATDPAPSPLQKQPDVTVLLRVKGSAAPAATALFRTQLNFALFPDQEWHWAVVRAKGVPPPAAPANEALTTPPATARTVVPAMGSDVSSRTLPVNPPASPSAADAGLHDR